MKTILETQRIFLRELTLEDTYNLSLVLSDIESMRYYPKKFTINEVENWIKRNIDRYKNDGFGLWAVIRKNDGKFLGDCGITLQNIDNEILPEIGYHIIKVFTNMGYASEAAKICKDYAINELKYPAIYSYSQYNNIASQRVAQKIGMNKIKTFKKDGILELVYGYKI